MRDRLSRLRIHSLRFCLGIAALTFQTSSLIAADWSVGATIGNVPWEFQQQDGSNAGFEVELINEVAKRLGRTLEIENIPFEGLVPALLANRVQIGISSLTITQERLKSLAFAQPYYDSDQSLTTLASSGINELDALKGKKIGVDSAATSDIWATEHSAEYAFESINRYDAMNSAILDLSAGRIDAYIADMPAIAYFIKDKPQFRIVSRITTGEQYSLVFNKDFGEIQAVNDALTVMKKEGYLAALHKKWFGTEAPADSSTVVVKPMPKAE
ncbi:ABC transporter substrate-binding protein [Rhizobium beringeri]|uniref:ABC transporter substrate-binding protein n=1 Tax=Rhizobium beringeri TaxID=3019934 RepID=UPI003B596E84